MKNQKRLIKMFFLISGLFLTSIIYAQQNVTGVINDTSGNPIPGVSILLKGTSQGTSSDFDGNYSITIPENAILVFSYIGYIQKEVSVLGKTGINVILEEDLTQLDEVVVVGYGKQKKVNLNGAVQTAIFKDEVNQPVTNSGQLLYGRFSGVQLTQASGSPGADGSSIVIRGIGTFGNSTPLVVIDNIQYADLSAFNSLAPSDIASITVLKDASASAIYGARAANGVLLVVTKKGKADKFEINYNTYYGMQEVTVNPDFLGAYDYANIINEKFRNQDETS